MTDYVRVRLDNGAETTTSREYAEANSGSMKILDEKAALAHDKPREPKYPADLAAADVADPPADPPADSAPADTKSTAGAKPKETAK